ncbi:MAG: DUF7346 family protein [Halobacteriota archaeon]
MRTVRDRSGKHYLLLKESGESSRVRDPETGSERYLPNSALEPVGGESPLQTAAAAVPQSVRRVLTAVHSEWALGLLVELAVRGPLPAVDLLDSYDRCESDLYGILAEFRAAGLVEERRVAGERGYGATDTAISAVEFLTSAADGDSVVTE